MSYPCLPLFIGIPDKHVIAPSSRRMVQTNEHVRVCIENRSPHRHIHYQVGGDSFERDACYSQPRKVNVSSRSFSRDPYQRYKIQ
jgi:hypothetical protein